MFVLRSLPRLRLLEIFPVQANGTKVFCLRDPEGYQDDPVYLSAEACLVAVMLDGSSGVGDIQAAFSRHFKGQKIKEEDIWRVIATLDECFLLDNENFAKRKATMDAAFKASKARDPYLAGRAYPRKAEELSRFLNQFYQDPKGPGGSPKAEKQGRLAGLIAPHIDFYRGGWCYAHAYKTLAETQPPKRILMLGVAHAGSPAPFVFCAKSYKTPLGPVPLDEDGLDIIRSRLGDAVFEQEGLHRTEHSLEFQAVWLAHIWPQKPPAALPVLVASFGAETPADSPRLLEEVERTIEALAQAYQGGDTLILAGVDLAHVGPRFGGDEPLSEALAERTRRQDEQSLAEIVACNAQGFWNSVVRDGNKRKVCGLSAIYTALRLLSKRPGKLLAYGQALDPAGGIVSFASAVFPK